MLVSEVEIDELCVRYRENGVGRIGGFRDPYCLGRRIGRTRQRSEVLWSAECRFDVVWRVA